MAFPRASGSGSSGSGGGSAQTTWIGAGSEDGAVLPNGIPYTPLAKGSTFQFDFIASVTGTQNIELLYFMGSAQDANVNLRVDYVAISDGSTPTDSLTTQSAFTISPGSNATKHRATISDSTTLGIPVTEGDHVYVLITRLDSGDDTHDGSFNLLGVRLT